MSSLIIVKLWGLSNCCGYRYQKYTTSLLTSSTSSAAAIFGRLNRVQFGQLHQAYKQTKNHGRFAWRTDVLAWLDYNHRAKSNSIDCSSIRCVRIFHSLLCHPTDFSNMHIMHALRFGSGTLFLLRHSNCAPKIRTQNTNSCCALFSLRFMPIIDAFGSRCCAKSPVIARTDNQGTQHETFRPWSRSNSPKGEQQQKEKTE